MNTNIELARSRTISRIDRIRKAREPDWARGWNGEGARKRPVAYSHGKASFARGERYADEIVRLGHTGWYADNDCGSIDGTIRGIVESLPHGRFLEGYECSETGERVLFLDCIYEDEKEAARGADHEAARIAEIEREYRERADAARMLEDDIDETLERVRELCALRNLPRFPGAREELRAAIDRVRELRESREPDHADFI